ncbi:hypothetical protein PVAP13_9KG255400 [Panicum virgatum]|uniref:Uncharacterized protein n=1 Tax=Panicum virgatum TaxID=38727 RepID=A0A8T0NMT0_PANVG|nr:hypothetical protein PVAP13_9KG255400 [Panicum virgatum]
MAAAAGPSPHPPPTPSHGSGGGRGLCGGHGGRIRTEHGGTAVAGPPSPHPPSSRNVPWRWRRPSSLPLRDAPSSCGGQIRARLGAPRSGGSRIRPLRATCVRVARRSRAHGGAGALTSASLCGIARWDDGSSEELIFIISSLSDMLLTGLWTDEPCNADGDFLIVPQKGNLAPLMWHSFGTMIVLL